MTRVSLGGGGSLFERVGKLGERGSARGYGSSRRQRLGGRVPGQASMRIKCPIPRVT